MTFVPRHGNDQKKLSVFLLNPRTKMLAWIDKQLEKYSEDFYEERADFRGNLGFHFIGNESSWPFQEFLSHINKMQALRSVAKAENPQDESHHDKESYGSYFGL
jgi:hypothetical protein